MKQSTGLKERQFASDNGAGICPEAWAALQRANHGHAPGYGEDAWTQHAADLIREVFEADCDVYFAFNGTAANSMALASLCRSYHGVICHESAHVEVDECGAPEFFSGGSKILTAGGEHGRIDPAEVEALCTRRSDIHFPRPRALSLTQATELGTVYSIAQLDALREFATHHGLNVHMDGARFANAVASTGASPADLTWKRGVDVLCLGGTKNGMAVGEAVVFFDRALAHEFDLRCKQAGQLASKMRFLAAPWVGMLEGGAWLRHAAHANAMAARMEGRLRQIAREVNVDGAWVGAAPLGAPSASSASSSSSSCARPHADTIELPHPREANAVFARLPKPWVAAMHARGWRFYDFFAGGLCRLMCSWDTTEADVDAFVEELREVAGRGITGGR
jgi:threonine aldolase